MSSAFSSALSVAMERPLRQRSSKRGRAALELLPEDGTPGFRFDKYAALPHIG